MPKRASKSSQNNGNEHAAVPNSSLPLKVFISWSGERSNLVAKALTSWLPEVIEGIVPWISTHDIPAGSRWNPEIDRQLRETNFGIVCLTRDNLQAPWILFEAGAVAKAVELAKVVPYRLQLPPSEVKPPLSQFQGVSADRKGTLDLVRGVNVECGPKYDEVRLQKKFDKWWPDLEKELSDIPNEEGENRPRPERELLEEVLEISRRQKYPIDDLRG